MRLDSAMVDAAAAAGNGPAAALARAAMAFAVEAACLAKLSPREVFAGLYAPKPEQAA